MPTSNRSVHFGAGRIGRALVGNILHTSGYDVTFVDVSRTVVDAINQHGHYPLRVVAPDGETTQIVDRVHALHFDDTEQIERAIAGAQLVSTSVGPLQLPVVAPKIAAGLKRRFNGAHAEPINIVPFENSYENGDLLRKLVFSHLNDSERARFQSLCGFPNTTITVTAFDVKTPDPTGLMVGIDRPQDREIVADRAGFVPPQPLLAEIILTDELARFEDRKMFAAGAHAIGAYAGHLRGHTVYSEAMQDPSVRETLHGSMTEMSGILQKMRGFSADEMKQFLDPLVLRFEDLRFADPIARVARDPKRKLAPRERIVRPARYAFQEGLPCEHLIVGIASAMKYDHPQDKEAREIQKAMRDEGFEKTLSAVTGLQSEEELGRRAQKAWKTICFKDRRKK